MPIGMGLGLVVPRRGLVGGVRNPHGAGAVAPSTAPTNWTLNNSAGINWSVVGAGDGYVDLRLSGTASGTSSPSILPESSTQIVAALGETWIGTLTTELRAGTWSPATATIESGERTSGGSSLTSTSVAVSFSATPTAYQVARVFNQATVARATNALRVSIANGTVFDATLRFRGFDIVKLD